MPVKTSLKDGKLHMKAKLNIAKTRNSGNGVENVDSKRKGAGRNKKVQSRGSTGDNVDYVGGIKSSSGKRSDKLRTRDGRKEVGDYGSEGLMSSSGKRSEKLRTRDGRKEVGDYGSEGLMSSSGKRSEKLGTRDGRKEVGDYGSEGLMSSSGKRNEKLRTRDGRKEVGDYGSEGLMSSSGKRGLKLRTRDGRKEVGDYGSEGLMPSSGKSERKTFGDDGNEGLMLNSRKRSTKLRTKDERREVRNDGNEGFKLGNLNKNRKRVYADQNLENVEISNGSNRKANAVIGNQTTKARSKNLEHTGVRSATEGRRKLKASESVENKNSRGLSKSNAIDKVENAEINGMLKKSGKGISERRKQLDQDLSKKVADNLKRSTKKKVRGNKSTGDDADKTEQKPKKKKRVIRIDPYDTSNKRLDDGLASNDGEEKKKDLPKTSNAELSKNAQFRAICPSPSILSFVEDNLLGRRREIEIKRAGYNIELSAPLDNIPFSTSTERERIEEPVFRNKLSFFAAAKVSSSFPPPELPEIAFAGRSNVGKSSLLNSLTRQWGVVRTSDKPGLTQTINFFKLGSKLCLVDLPGYGFAYAKEEVKEAWEELVKEYVSTRVGLKRVCLLVDTKWGMKPRDYELVDLMERSQTKYQIVLTKTDLVFPIDVARRAMQIEESLKQKKSAVQPVMMASSKSGAGIRSLRTALSKIARFVKP